MATRGVRECLPGDRCSSQNIYEKLRGASPAETRVTENEGQTRDIMSVRSALRSASTLRCV